MGSAFITAAIFHALIILGVTFETEDVTPKQSDQLLDVILVKPRDTITEPEKADFLAPVSQQGAASIAGHSRPAAPAAPNTEKANSKPAPNIQRSGAPQPAEISRKSVVESANAPRADYYL